MRRLVLLACVLAVPRVASAVPCDQVPNLGTIVYAQVGDTQANLMRRLARDLRNSAAKPLALVWRTSGSCTNIDALYNNVAIPAATVMQYVESATENPNWTPTTPNKTCELPSAIVPNIGNSALFNSACPGGDSPPATVKLTQGPVQAYVLAVPAVSTATAITYEEAYFTFGFGTAGMIDPWDDENEMFIRTNTKSTLLAWAANISVPAAKWKGMRFDASSEVVGKLKASTNPKSIGILGAEVYDAERVNGLKSLAFRARGQYAAYYPDSTSTAIDKQNVRDGHYTVWSPTVWMDTLSNGTPVNAHARYIIDLIAGHTTVPKADFDMTAIIANVGLTPDCAMGVKREFEGGPLSLYTPAESCVCKYESLVATSSCATCTNSCATGVCRNGFCEVQ